MGCSKKQPRSIFRSRIERILFLITIIVFRPQDTFCESNLSEVQNEVKKFVTIILSNERKPTLSDYDEFYGHSENEASIAIKVCEVICKDKDTNSLIKDPQCSLIKDPQCLRYIKGRQKDREQKTSLYLEWLRTKLPLAPKRVSIKEVKYVGYEGDQNMFDHEIIRSLLDDTGVIFFKPIKHRYAPNFGSINVIEINGVRVSEMLEKDLSNFPREKNPITKIIEKEVLSLSKFK